MNASPKTSIAARYPLVLLLTVVLVITTLLVYSSVVDCWFINLADTAYVVRNPHVQMGLTGPSIRWAFSRLDQGQWQPLTWMSLQLDYHIYERLDPGPYGVRKLTLHGLYHLTNLLLHLANTVLLFLLLARMTGAIWRSALVAGLFALHPLHVESVAWVAERNDVLSTLFWLLTLWAYVWYAEKPGLARYALVVLAYVLGLMTKPMLVTLPCVLLLLDYWPLGRWKLFARRRLNMEKLPLLGLSLAVCAITLQAQAFSEFPGVAVTYPLYIRALNAVQAYLGYLVKLAWPVNLAVIYPHPGAAVSTLQTLGAGVVLIAGTVLVFGAARRRPYLPVGWFWYLGTLVPVLGLVPLGDQAMADHYTYVPSIGLFLALAWGLGDLAETVGGRWLKVALTAAAAVALAACGYRTWEQVGHWRDARSLWRHALDVTANNYIAYDYLGQYYFERGHAQAAEPLFRESVRINPSNAPCWNALGLSSLVNSNIVQGREEIAKAVQLRPDQAELHYNLALAYLVGPAAQLDTALAQAREAVELNGAEVPSRCLLAYVLHETGNTQEAAHHYQAALRLDAGWPATANRNAWRLATRDPSPSTEAPVAVDPSPWVAMLALLYAREACQATTEPRGEYLDTLAVAEAANCHFPQAIEAERKALELLGDTTSPAHQRMMKKRLQAYEKALR